jgi:hypothetical protein
MLPKLATGVPAFEWRQPIPFGPLAAHDVFGVNHAQELFILLVCSSVVFGTASKVMDAPSPAGHAKFDPRKSDAAGNAAAEGRPLARGCAVLMPLRDLLDRFV